jgi:hypothetical protein
MGFRVISDYFLKLTPWRQNPKVHYRIYKSPPPSLFWASCIHSTTPANHPKIHSDPIYASVFRVVSFLRASPQNYCTLFSPKHATCSTRLILLDLICLMLFGDEYKLWRCSMCSFLHSPVTSFHVGPNIFLKTLVSIYLEDTHYICAK